jgi:hypothetical protein
VKKVLLKSTILLILYILAYLYFAVFNWQIFIVKLNINLGFGVVEFPPFIVLFLLGFIFIGILSWTNYNIRLRKMIYELEHGVEMVKIKDKLVSTKVREYLLEEKNLDLLKDKMGIKEIQKTQEELMKFIDNLKSKPEQKQ